MLSLFLRQRLRELLADVGDVRSLAIDSAARTISASIELEGEASPLDVLLRGYGFEREGEQVYLVFSGVEASRPWVSTAVKKFLKRPRVRIPDEYADIAERLLG